MASYYVYSGAGGSANGSSWANAFTTLTTAFATEAAGDTLYVAHDHAETTAGSIVLASSGTTAILTKIVCVNRAGSVPPVSADRRTTAQVTTTGSGAISITGSAHFDGIIFNAGTGASSVTLAVSSSQTRQIYTNCSLRLVTTSASSTMTIASLNTGGSYVELNNTTLSFANVAQFITVYNALRWINTPAALLGTIPTTLFIPASGTRGGRVECIGVDLSAAGSGKTIVGVNNGAQDCSFSFVDCKLHASVTKSTAPGNEGAYTVDCVRCGSSGVNYNVYIDRGAGRLIEETTIVRTGGASDGTTPLAWKIDTTANCNYSMPFECPPIAIWNDTTGSSVTATVEGIWGGGAVPLDNEIFLECEYLGDASSPMGSFVHDGTADLLTTAANQTSSSEAWGGSTSKFKLAVSFTPQQKGWIYARVKVGKASSTFYVDPLITLT